MEDKNDIPIQEDFEKMVDYILNYNVKRVKSIVQAKD